MAAAWIISFLLYGPLIISWEHIAGYSNIPEGECNPEYYYSHYFRLWSSIIFFFTPFVAILYLNVSIYINIQTRTRAKQKHLVGPTRESNAQRDTTTIFTILDLENNEGNNSFSGPGYSKKQPSILKESGAVKHIVHTDSLNGVTVLEMPTENKLKILHITKHSALLSAEIKIAKSLSVLVGIFCLCWAPYSLILLVGAICQQNSIPAEWNDITYAFTYLNSSFNPFFYPMCHPAFKKAFIKILFPKKCGFKSARRKTGNVQSKTSRSRMFR